MDKPAKPMKITHENVRFQTIKHNTGFRLGNEYISDVRYNYHTFVPAVDCYKNSLAIEDMIKQKHVEGLDYIIYGQYRKYLKYQLFRFINEMDKYKRTYRDFSEYVIPECKISEMTGDILELINEI